MVMNSSFRILYLCSVVFLSLFFLTGCPGRGDRLKPDETAFMNVNGNDVCFQVLDAEDYQPSIIGINPRGKKGKEIRYTPDPDLKVIDGQLCIPPSFYPFTEKGQYIVKYILQSKSKVDATRSVVVGVEVSERRISTFLLTDMEILRPYHKMLKK